MEKEIDFEQDTPKEDIGATKQGPPEAEEQGPADEEQEAVSPEKQLEQLLESFYDSVREHLVEFKKAVARAKEDGFKISKGLILYRLRQSHPEIADNLSATPEFDRETFVNIVEAAADQATFAGWQKLFKEKGGFAGEYKRILSYLKGEAAKQEED